MVRGRVQPLWVLCTQSGRTSSRKEMGKNKEKRGEGKISARLSQSIIQPILAIEAATTTFQPLPVPAKSLPACRCHHLLPPLLPPSPRALFPLSFSLLCVDRGGDQRDGVMWRQRVREYEADPFSSPPISTNRSCVGHLRCFLLFLTD
jgi:hypothetical protein